ncbi:hypothetical protein DSCO28_09930 [Desulfosarcina ovata subsp. sediminis]|uniref:Uncharacterized protein n=1 Tax=Desulfosarcina ovata subsp. sediminis TaxID=885957 RepID=A0A5K7ZKC0_9BACT|nr:hypothetical protein DSCO28_09930 [Desulfosarcina ovata subsp. sediminis]
MIAMELLKMRSVPALRWIINHKDQPRAFPPSTAHTACDLDITCSRLWLANNTHKGKTVNVNSDLDYIGCKACIYGFIDSSCLVGFR